MDISSSWRSERLRLRALSRADAPFFHALWRSRGVRAALYHDREPPSLARVEAWVDARVGDPPRIFVVERDERAIGYVGIQPLPETGEPELFYALADDAWGQGYAAEAARSVLEHAREALGLATLVAIVHPDNLRSARVLEKLGFRRAGTQLHHGSEHARFVRDLAAHR